MILHILMTMLILVSLFVFISICGYYSVRNLENFEVRHNQRMRGFQNFDPDNY